MPPKIVPVQLARAARLPALHLDGNSIKDFCPDCFLKKDRGTVQIGNIVVIAGGYNSIVRNHFEKGHSFFLSASFGMNHWREGLYARTSDQTRKVRGASLNKAGH
jgi:hypothetical protein